jgi:photosystem II stability/assembly factor-like uncharacterized protein
VAGVPGDDLTYYAATAAGGVWKSVNGGSKWESIFDDQPISSIGSIAVAPSDPNVVWVGSGEANIRGNVAEGNGIYRSTDAGETWKHVWSAEGQIGTMAVHPEDPDIAFAAVLGSPFGAGPDRGVLRTTDGGETWQKVLYKDPDTGASDVCFHPSNPRILFAGLWQARRFPWGLTSGGPGSGLYVSRDGGDNWQKLENRGLPGGIWGRVGVQVAASEPKRVYALIEAEEGGLFRSDNGGKKWTLVSASRGVRQRAWYYTTLTVDPANANVVWFPQVGMLKTDDGGKTIRSVKGGGWDYHDVWIDPENPKRMVVGSDAGVSLSRDGGETWFRPPLPISQLYHISVDTSTPYRVLSSLQDLGTVSGPSNSLHGGGILYSDWHSVGGGEAGHVVADPSDPNIVWAGEYLGIVTRYDRRTGEAPHVGIYPDNGSGHGAIDLRYRFQWTAPIVISPHDPKVVYHAANVLFKTKDGGQSWQAISPDLTRDDPAKQEWAGGPITGDNTGVEFYNTIFAVAESPVEAGTIWAGTDDGLVHVTRNGGGSWNDVTPAAVPEWGTVSTVEASRWDAGTAYVVADAHRLDNETPYLFKTTDYGASWESLTAGLDENIYLHVVREDTRRKGMLYLGTERGVMFSRDGGASWESLRLNMPTVSVVDLAVAGDDLVVGTLGRSAWILDDLTPVREMSPEIAAAREHFFAPLPAARWRYAANARGSSAGAGENPPEGSIITYFLKDKPEGEVVLEVLDADGAPARRLSSKLKTPYTPEDHTDRSPTAKPEPEITAEQGLNRVSWDLGVDAPRWVDGSRNDSGAPSPGPMVPPGDYTLRLTVDGRVSTQMLRVEPDPRSPASAADLEELMDYAFGVREKLATIVEMAETIRALRDQIEDRNTRLAEDPDASELIKLGKKLIADLDAIEEKIHNPYAEVDYDILGGRHGGAMLYSRLIWLFELSADLDGPPTQGMLEVAADLEQQLTAQGAALAGLLSEDLAKLNELAKEEDVPYVVTP